MYEHLSALLDRGLSEEVVVFSLLYAHKTPPLCIIMRHARVFNTQVKCRHTHKPGCAAWFYECCGLILNILHNTYNLFQHYQVSEIVAVHLSRLLLTVNWAILQLCHGRNKLNVNEKVMPLCTIQKCLVEFHGATKCRYWKNTV